MSATNLGNTGYKAHTAGGEPRTNYPRTQGTTQDESKKLFEHRKAAGLCFRCGDKYQPGHRCQNQSLHLINASLDPDEVFDEQLLQLDDEEDTPPEQEEEGEVGVSVHALSGQNQNDTIKVQGEVGDRKVSILIDTGSTHSFIDFRVAKEVKALMTAAPPLTVIVANGHKVMSKLKCSNFRWTMQGEPYQFELRVIRLDGSSIILGINWLKAYGKVTFDYNDNSVSFMKEGRQTSLKGIEEGPTDKPPSAELKFISAVQWYKAGLKGSCCVIGQYCAERIEKGRDIPERIQQVLD